MNNVDDWFAEHVVPVCVVCSITLIVVIVAGLIIFGILFKYDNNKKYYRITICKLIKNMPDLNGRTMYGRNPLPEYDINEYSSIYLYTAILEDKILFEKDDEFDNHLARRYCPMYHIEYWNTHTYWFKYRTTQNYIYSLRDNLESEGYVCILDEEIKYDECPRKDLDWAKIP